MSLINEALKRTRDSAYQAAQTSPPVPAGYRLENGLKVRDSKTIIRVMGASVAAALAGVVVLVVWLVPRIEGVKDGLMPNKGLSTPSGRAPATTAAPPKTEVGVSGEAEERDKRPRQSVALHEGDDGGGGEGNPSSQAPAAILKTEVAVSGEAKERDKRPRQSVALHEGSDGGGEAEPSTQAAAAVAVPDAKRAEDEIVDRVMERIKAGPPAAPSAPQLVLQGITYAPDNRDAMINGVTVHEGDVIEGARVVTIETRRVALNFNGQEIILRLP
jgi:hypothetical protein